LARPGSTRARGDRGEARAVVELEKLGLRVVDRNCVCAGVELDLVCQALESEPTLIIFVEVRTRASDRHGHPIETIGPAKRKRLIRGATAWLVAHDLWERCAVRFDVVTLNGDEFEWTQAAFDSTGT
jgi:putative endonuclease